MSGGVGCRVVGLAETIINSVKLKLKTRLSLAKIRKNYPGALNPSLGISFRFLILEIKMVKLARQSIIY